MFTPVDGETICVETVPLPWAGSHQLSYHSRQRKGWSIKAIRPTCSCRPNCSLKCICYCHVQSGFNHHLRDYISLQKFSNWVALLFWFWFYELFNLSQSLRSTTQFIFTLLSVLTLKKFSIKSHFWLCNRCFCVAAILQNHPFLYPRVMQQVDTQSDYTRPPHNVKTLFSSFSSGAWC